MPRFKLTLEYHGGPFVGWQRQASGRSVQGALERALAAIDPAGPSATGAGRTDAGVHALGQVAHADLRRDWAPFRLCAALNAHLAPDPVAVLAAEPVHPDFHARFDAVEREYLYRILDRRAPATLARGLVWRVAGDLDAAAMARAAAALVGRHDFTTFRATQCQALSPVKTLDALEVTREEGEWGAELRIRARARSFLHNQVRIFAGTLKWAGEGKWDDTRVRQALEARDRAAAGPTAPPEGLYLQTVRYPENSPIPE